MPRYSQGKPLKRSIMHVIIYESFNASGGIIQHPSPPTNADQTPPVAVPVSTSGFSARVKADVAWGLNIRLSIDTSSSSNIIISVPAGTLLNVIGADDYAKIGGVNQWVRVSDNKGHEGFAAAWYLEKTQTAAPAIESVSTPTLKEEPPVVTSKPIPYQMVVVVKSRVGKFGAKIYETESVKSHIVATEKMRAKLNVIEDASKARPKIGKAGKWLNVQNKDGKKGFVNAELVALEEPT